MREEFLTDTDFAIKVFVVSEPNDGCASLFLFFSLFFCFCFSFDINDITRLFSSPPTEEERINRCRTEQRGFDTDR